MYSLSSNLGMVQVENKWNQTAVYSFKSGDIVLLPHERSMVSYGVASYSLICVVQTNGVGVLIEYEYTLVDLEPTTISDLCVFVCVCVCVCVCVEFRAADAAPAY